MATPASRSPASRSPASRSPHQATDAGGFGIFALIWLGQVVSTLGTGMTAFALGVKIFQDTESVTRFALIALAVGLPNVLLGPVVGVLADRWNRRLILILANLGSGLATLGLVALVAAGQTRTWQVYGIIALGAACSAFIFPTFAAATTLLVGKQHFGRASGMNQMGNAVAQIMAPLLGGLLVVSIGLAGVILIDVVTFLFATVSLLFVRFPPTPASAEEADDNGDGTRASAGFLTVALRGWTFIRQRPGLLGLLLLFAALNFSVGMVHVLITPMVLSFASARMLGVVLAIASSGMLVGGIVMSVWGGPARRVPTILYTALGQGVLLLLAGLQPSATLVASAAFFFLLLFPILIGCAQAIWLAKVPPDLQGRVFATRRMIAFSTLPVAQIIAGPLADGVFEPWLAADGSLANSVGRVIGVGPGRGIALMLVVLGVGTVITALVSMRFRALSRLEHDLPDAVDSSAAASTLDPAVGSVRGTDATITGTSLALPRVPALLLALTVTAIATLAVAWQRPPPVRGQDAPAEAFSAVRARPHVAAISQEPHPTGSVAQARVRDYVIVQLTRLGLAPHIQQATSVAERLGMVQVVAVENILARLPGKASATGRAPSTEKAASGRAIGDHGPADAILLVAHYDTVAESPGASDNGAAVAALLETARALLAGPPLAGDVILLFTDAEEVGLHGARAFVNEHPWARGVDVVINLDARGHGGPVYLFQTGSGNTHAQERGNGRLIAAFAHGVSPAYGNSLMTYLYRLLPNDTDFSVFLEAGYAGTNLAFINGLSHYHSALDRVDDLDSRSLQHQGDHALGLARQLASEAASETAADRAYFNVLGGGLVHHSRSLSFLFAAITLGLGFVVLRKGFRQGRLSGFGIWKGFLAFFGQLIAIPVAMTLLWFVIRDLAGLPIHLGSTASAGRFMVAMSLFTVATFCLLHGFWRRMVSIPHLTVGALLWWLLALLLTSGILLPVTTNSLFVWPLFAGLAAFAFLFRSRAHQAATWRTAVILTFTALPVLLIGVPFAATAYVGLQGLFQLGGAALAWIVLLLGALIPQLEAVSARQPRWLPIAASSIGILFLAWALTGHPRQHESSVLYAWDADTDERFWYSFDDQPNDWTRTFGLDGSERASFARFFPLFPREILRAPADKVALEAPTIPVTFPADSSQAEHGQQEAVMFIPNLPGRRVRGIWFEPASAVTAVRLNGKTIDLRGHQTQAVIQQFPLHGPSTEMLVRIRGSEAVTVHITEQIAGMPAAEGLVPRPPDLLPSHLFTLARSDVTLIHRTIVLPAGPFT